MIHRKYPSLQDLSIGVVKSRYRTKHMSGKNMEKTKRKDYRCEQFRFSHAHWLETDGPMKIFDVRKVVRNNRGIYFVISGRGEDASCGV